MKKNATGNAAAAMTLASETIRNTSQHRDPHRRRPTTIGGHASVKNTPAAGGHALAALEAQPHREAVPDHRREPGRGRPSPGSAVTCRISTTAATPLAMSSTRDRQRHLPPCGAHGVGGADVARPDLAHVAPPREPSRRGRRTGSSPGSTPRPASSRAPSPPPRPLTPRPASAAAACTPAPTGASSLLEEHRLPRHELGEAATSPPRPGSAPPPAHPTVAPGAPASGGARTDAPPAPPRAPRRHRPSPPPSARARRACSAHPRHARAALVREEAAPAEPHGHRRQRRQRGRCDAVRAVDTAPAPARRGT